jgi:hypothetical protein
MLPMHVPKIAKLIMSAYILCYVRNWHCYESFPLMMIQLSFEYTV